MISRLGDSMNEIELRLPGKEFESAALDYKKEHFDYHEYEIHGSSLFNKVDSYDKWLKQEFIYHGKAVQKYWFHL